MRKSSNRLLFSFIILSSLIFTGLATPVHAQFYNGSQLTFGKNRVQHTVDRFWTHFRYPAFDTYFYLGGREYGIYTARYAMEVIPEIERRLDYTLTEKIQFIIFNNLSELKESNIGLLSEQQYNIGGVTYIVGTKIFLYFDGSYINLERQIRAGLARVMIDEMLYGSEVTSQIKNSTLINFPEWYLSGLISYITYDWNTETDNYVRDGILSGRYQNFNSLSGEDAVYAGHSFWKYVADKYGRNTIPNILYMTKVSRQISNGFLFVLGVPFNTLADEWMSYFKNDFYRWDDDRGAPEGKLFPIKMRKEMVLQQVSVSPDERYIAYATNRSGRYRVLLYDAETGKTKRLFRRGQRLDEKVDDSYPLIAWHPSSLLLTFVVEEGAYSWLYTYTLEEDLLERDMLSDFQKVTSYAFSANGELLVLSAVKRGQSDLFVFSRSSRTSEQITRDIYDDYAPRFIENGRRIVFSSNRPDDTIRFDPVTARIDTHKVIDRQPYYDIFAYDYRSRSSVLQQITNTPDVNELYPLEFERGYVTFLSDQNGIYNRHLARFDSAIAFVDTVTHYTYFAEIFPISNFRRSVLEHNINKPGGSLTSIFYEKGTYHLYLQPLESAASIGPVSMTNTSYRMQQLAQSQRNKAQPTPLMPEQVSDPDLDTTAAPEAKRRFVTVRTTTQSADSTGIDFDQYVIGGGDQTDDVAEKGSGFFIPRERVYHVAFSINQLVSQVNLGYLNAGYQPFAGGGQPIFINSGVTSFFKIGLTDLLEDYRITGGVHLSFSLTNNEYFLSFENLKNRWDRQLLIHRKSLETFGTSSIIRRYTHDIHYLWKYPFSNVFSMRHGLILRLEQDIFTSTDLTNLQRKDEMRAWVTGRSELIFDNTRNRGMNTLFGTRWKVFGEYYQHATKLDQQMIVLGGDYRYYQQIHKTFIWANRVAASTSLGNNRLIYYMGGVDNWLLPKFNNQINIDQSIPWRYQTLATNMRGFHQNIRNGNSFIILNSELRFPVFRYLFDRPLRNNFLNHFQLICFGDLGTAWTGANPWSEQNALYTQTIEQGPIKMTVRRQVEPIVGGFGLGVRSSLFGYFIRGDYGWGVEDGTTTKGVFYLSLGLDF
jgi:hypothetical protein